DLVRDHLKNYTGEILPTFFENGGKYRLGVSVYLQVIPYIMFGKSVFVTRAVSVLVSLLAAAAVGLALRQLFKVRIWWAGVLFLSLTPAWFLHSRTAFECAAAAAFYAASLYCYLRYRLQSPPSLYAALAFGALAFYTYSPFQIIAPASFLILFVLDWRYHLENRRMAVPAIGLLVLLGLPYLRFVLTHSQENLSSLAALNSPWARPLPLGEKMRLTAVEYLRALNPTYWFTPDEGGLARHQMNDKAYLTRWTFPFLLLGFGQAVWRARPGRKQDGQPAVNQELAPAYRVLLVSVFAIPLGAALVQVGITRLLGLVIPAALLTTLGIQRCIVWLGKRRVPVYLLESGLLILLAIANFALLREALWKGPTWTTNYGMGGMQYGASQVFDAAQEYITEYPDTRMIVSPTWANGTDVLKRFFLPDDLPVELGSISGHLQNQKALDRQMLFVMTPDEYEAVLQSGKFVNIQVEQTLPFPNGQTGFYFVRLDYAPNIQELMAGELAERRKLQAAEAQVDGELVQFSHSTLDIGTIEQAFDGDTNTLLRTWEANPMVIEMRFPRPRRLSGIELILGSAQIEVTLRLSDPSQGQPVVLSQVVRGTVQQPRVELTFPEAYLVQTLRLELRDVNQGEPGHVHLWEIDLQTQAGGES
ncbi:MAG TPA: hypothetical protein VN363_04675, partial [Anaerolineales bacterium]|nr:hypothetical protein [Anaerolineales bacterium]